MYYILIPIDISQALPINWASQETTFTQGNMLKKHSSKGKFDDNNKKRRNGDLIIENGHHTYGSRHSSDTASGMILFHLKIWFNANFILDTFWSIMSLH